MSIVTRYAPSPTGALHIGGARTALFNWALARHAGGRFLLRFEDTDRARSTVESELEVLEALNWLGLDHDPLPSFDGIPRQSERGERYRELIDGLLASGKAFRCTCPAERLTALREAARKAGSKRTYDGACRDKDLSADTAEPFCIRLRLPESAITHWEDAIAGASGEDLSQLDDFVIARADGTPIYHLAVVVDDHDMRVTDVLRGREHMTSTPRQLLLYAALDFEPPRFAHVPLLVEPGGKKLSKRHDSVSVQSYRDRGFPADAVLNFIARLGWGHGDLEVFSREELCKLFTLEGVGKSPSQVHDDKLLWLSQQYIKALPAEALIACALPFLEAEAHGPVSADNGLLRLLELLRERSKTFAEMADHAAFYLNDTIEVDAKAARKHLKPALAGPLHELRDAFAALSEWSEAGLEASLHAIAERHELGLGKLAQPVRVAVVGRAVSPGIFETLALLGRERSLGRLDQALGSLSEGDSAQD